MNPIQYLIQQGFLKTSDPNDYASGVWGLRNYTLNGFNYDSFCGGYHRAYDFAKQHLSPIPAVMDGIVASGTTAYGNFGGQVVIGSKEKNVQTIYGHLARNIPVKIGQKVKQGQTIGYQSNTNYYNTYMASHLHIQFQNYGYIAGEQAFVCTGIDPLKIDVGGTVKKSTAKNDKVLTYNSAWNWSGKIKTNAAINYRIYPHTSAKKEDAIKKGTTLTFDRLYDSDGHWWVRVKYNGGIWFIAVGKKESGVKFITALDSKKLWVTGVGKVNTKGGRVEGKKNTYTIADAYETDRVIDEKIKNQPVYNPNKNRSRSTSGSYVSGKIDSLGAAIMNRNGSQKAGFNWNTYSGYDLKPGEVVHIYEIHDGWGRIKTGALSGPYSNRWIWLGRMQPIKVFK